MRSFFKLVPIAVAAMIAASLTGCPGPTHYCGDGVCERSEISWCSTDCGSPPAGDAGPGPSGQRSCGDLPISTTAVQLSTGNVQQSCTEWCWAATASNIGVYFGRPFSECQLVSYSIGDQSQNLCCQYTACGYSVCNHAVPATEMTNLLLAMGIHGTAVARPLSEHEIQVELSNGRPVIVGYSGAQSGHFAAITGFVPGTPATYTVDDPWPYSGVTNTRFHWTYGKILNGPNGLTPWHTSWYRLSTRTDGCVPSFDPSCGCDATAPNGTTPDAGPPPYDPMPDAGTKAACQDPAYPVDCGGTCWPAGTDCSLPTFSCGGKTSRCNDPTDKVSCCNGQLIACPAAYPYTCAGSTQCWSSPQPCTSSCQLSAVSCGG